MLTMEPEFRPYSAGKAELSILNSDKVSMGGWKVIWFCTGSFRLMPLTSQFVVSSRCPAVLTPKEPWPRSGKERKPLAGGVMVPGVSRLRSVKWRPFRGTSCTYLSLITCPILFVVVSRITASAVISTVAEASPTLSWMFCVTEVATGRSRPATNAFWKPAAVTSMRYLPMGSDGKRYAPALSD